LTGYLLRRAAWAVVVVVVVWLLTFLIAYVLPADPARLIAGPSATAADVAAIRHALGLDQPLLQQLADYGARLARGDLGHSFVLDGDVLPLLLERIPSTLELAFAGLALALAIGIPLGVYAAARRGSRVDVAISALSAVLASVPSFVIAIVLLLVGAFWLRSQFGIAFFPTGGDEPFDPRYLFLPALTLGIAGAAQYARLSRALVADELAREYVSVAEAKGLTTNLVLRRHVLRNASAPILARIGLDLGWFLGGVAVVERVFGWPGVGRLALQSVQTDDAPLIMGTVLLAAIVVVAANLATDVIAAAIDPRLALTEK
jgi:peptide/nickel transport system permease protein